MQVTTLLSKADELAAEAKGPAVDLDSMRAAASQQGATVKQAKEVCGCLILARKAFMQVIHLRPMTKLRSKQKFSAAEFEDMIARPKRCKL